MHWIDPDSLTPVKSKVARFLFNPRGKADGMILANGQEAHFPPHLSDQVLGSFEAGDRITLYGVKPRSADMIACVALETAAGARIDDTGPPSKAKKKGHGKQHEKHEPAHEELETRTVDMVDRVQRALHGPKGEVRGVLLESGQIVRFPPHAAHAMPKLCKVGSKLAVRGPAVDIEGVTVIEANELGRSKATLQRIPKDPRKHA